MKAYLPPWLHVWLGEINLVLQVLAIVVGALVLRWLARRLVNRLHRRYDLPIQIVVSARRLSGFVIGFGALLMILERFGVSGGVLWTAFTGFAAVAAVAFFAAWSVLTNVFCSLLLLLTRPFRLHDHIELLENGERAGLAGRVVDMNLIFVTLEETHPAGGESLLRVPNSLFFQRATRRWRGEPVPQPAPAGSRDDGGAQASTGGGGGAAVTSFP
ncbi:mechanosensitive ion channel family protein [Luteimonas viscosa]|uniref:Small-conductance mechanosensitive channel n=1 Tax=Luteimonas viscosa TaxID=1132694 RepID=A0A5D4XPD6_9GAMM|nr:mechanosensitive ion channel family protein [Luteimonas viscosa]TYT26538.1 mechanosensitive ion channel family protein [Luteimonas viscosa]